MRGAQRLQTPPQKKQKNQTPKQPYVTLARSRAYTDRIASALAPMGWQLLDTWHLTAARPEVM